MSSKQEASAAAVSDKETEIYTALMHVLDVVEMNEERNHISSSQLLDELLNAYASKLNTNLLTPLSCSKNYTGVHLGTLYEDSDFKLMLKMFKNNGILDAYYALKIINDAEHLLSKMTNINQCDATQHPCILVGDLHGNFHDLNHLIYKYNYPGKSYQFVFNGDFVDRGTKQIEVLLTILYAFIQRPDRVYLNRGNHEDLAMNTSSHFNPNFMSDCRRKYGKYASAIFNAATNLFTHLPLATIVKTNKTRIFIVHGGISESTDIEHLAKLDRKLFKRIVTYTVSHQSSSDHQESTKQIVDILWSDPIRTNEKGKIIPYGLKKLTGCFFNKTRNFGSLFGTDISEKFCKKYNFNYIIRSHECRDKGFSQDHPKCFTLFSASCYLNSTNMGAVILVTPNDKKFQVYAYSNPIETSNSNDGENKNHHSLLVKFKHLIQLNHFNLIPKYEQLDTNQTGMIDQYDWARVLSNEFEISVEHLILIKDFICECDSTQVCYKTMFKINDDLTTTKMNSLESENYLMLVKSLFEIIDKNHDNHISFDEAKEAIQLINSKRNMKNETSEEDCLKFIKQLDVNCDKLIDLNEFYKAFFYDEFAMSLNDLKLTSISSDDDDKDEEEEGSTSISSNESTSTSHLDAENGYDDDNDVISNDIHIVRI